MGESVIARNYSDGEKWLPGTIAEKLGPLLYSVKMDNGLLWRRHIDQCPNQVVHKQSQGFQQLQSHLYLDTRLLQ